MSTRLLILQAFSVIYGAAAAASVASKGAPSEVHIERHRRLPSESDNPEQQDESLFHNWMLKHGRTYKRGSDEYVQRKRFFFERLAAVRLQNDRPGARWKASVGRFSDYTEVERRALRGWRRPTDASSFETSHTSQLQPQSLVQVHDDNLPQSVSWLGLNVSENIRDQGGCGSCWAIAAVSVLEAHYEIYASHTGPIMSFSAQQVLDCTPNPQECGGTGGCKGATVELGMAWVLQHGITTEGEIPYLADDGDTQCPSQLKNNDTGPGVFMQESDGVVMAINSDGVVASMRKRAVPQNLAASTLGFASFQTLPRNVDMPLARAVQHGPVAVSAAASNWFEYEKGVFDGCDKDVIIDHAVVLYGYGEDPDTKHKYWQIRNSWGSQWGENGFIRLLRHEPGDRYCGLDVDPQQGTGCKGGVATVPVCGMCGILYDSVIPTFVSRPAASGSSEASRKPAAEVDHSEDDPAPPNDNYSPRGFGTSSKRLFRSGEQEQTASARITHGEAQAASTERAIDWSEDS